MGAPSPYTITGTLHEGGRTRLLRAVRSADGRPVILKVIDPRSGCSQDIERLRREYMMGKALRHEAFVEPLALETFEGLPALVMEDFGGESLDHLILLDAPMSAGRFLDLAVRLVTCVAELHQRDVLHKDLKPQNILVNATTGEVKLADFGLASRLPREQPPVGTPRLIEGSLPYLSPEQTGRMNRAIDGRADLYAVGVTFYQMLTGRLPFEARDPLEWVHCHVALAPPPPSAVVPGVPEVLSAIVVKLLAKMAEDRYQTARGLRHDLDRCLSQHRACGRIEPFSLGERDISGRVQLPQKLYGREREVSALRRTFERVVDTGVPELVLVSGYSGSGKSALVHELYRSIVRERALFLSGKFERSRRGVPHFTLVQAFRDVVCEILAEPEDRIAALRQRLLDALGPNGQLIVDVIPQVELVIGRQPQVPELPLAEAQHRFRVVFRRFIGAFARKEHPLVLFLDDLQWTNPASLGLLHDLMTHPEARHLLFVGAYRDNEVTPSHPLMMALDKVRKDGARVSDIVLGPLSREHLGALVGDALRCRSEDAAQLSALVHEKTAGNPFFAIQFLTALHEERLIELDERAERFRWDVAKIRDKGFTDNVIDLMVGKLVRLPPGAQEALKHLACLGSAAGVDLLAMVRGSSVEETHADLWDAVRAGLVLRRGASYRFVHDRVQEAAYSLIPEGERPAVHLGIGRLLASRAAPEALEEKIFEIVNQLDRGAPLITSRAERERVAELNLIAGKRARGSNACVLALRYLAVGRALLPEDGWERRYELTFELELHRAECEYLTGDLSAAEERLSALSRRAASLVDLAAVTCVRLGLYTTMDRSDRGVDVGLDYLRRVGVTWSPHPTDEEVRKEYERVWELLGSRSVEDLIDSPQMTDPECRATLDVLTHAQSPALFTDANLNCLVVTRMTTLCLERGNCDASCIAYTWFVVQRARFGLEVDIVTAQLRLIRALRGLLPDLSSFSDADFDERRFERRLEGDPRLAIATCWYWIRKLQARFLAGDLDGSLEAAEKARPLLWTSGSFFEVAEYHFYGALARAARCRAADAAERRRHLEALAAHQRQIDTWAESCPENFRDRAALIGAEIARLRGAWDDAAQLYEQAIRAGRASGFVHHEALAYEIASGFYRERGFELIADTYLREARACYVRWGADGKVRHIDQRNPRLWDARPLAPTASFAARFEQLDQLSVIKASQTLSSEIVLDKLLRTLLTVVLEQGGAQRACLVLHQDERLSVGAEAILEESGEVKTLLPRSGEGASQRVPMSLVRYVQRTKERVILSPTEALDGKFSGDAYFARRKPRSVLCMPILRQAEVAGLLYLENDLLAGAFPPERLTALSLLAAQAAISLENARLLSKEQAARTGAEAAERRAAFLAEAGEILSGSLDYEETLGRVARLAVQSLCDWCITDVVEGEQIRRSLWAHRDSAKESLIEQLRRRYSSALDSPHPAARALRRGEPLLVSGCSEEELRQYCEDDEHARLIHELGVQSLIVVPLMARGRPIGALSVVSSAPGRCYGEADLEIVQHVAHRAALAIDNARLYRATQEAIRMRDEFLTVATHELNTPMTSLTLSLEAMDRSLRSGRPCDPPAMGRQVERALRQVMRLARLNRELLEVSRIDTDRASLDLAEVDLGVVVRDVIARFELDLARAGCSVSLRISGRNVGSWDRSRVDQIVTNLVANAIKFGPGKPIEIVLGEEAGTTRLSVKDHGIGVDPARQERIFDRFERAVSERHYGGLGLGLYISRQIAQAHGGSIRVESAPGAGATFTVELPGAGPPVSPRAPVFSNDSIGSIR
ncbi:AAA family ATPase [Sorangium cellulosum]|nr:AAA family ATPase [Sorangium cellulosum]